MFYPLLRSALFCFDAETVHHAAFHALNSPPAPLLFRRPSVCDHPRLARTLWGSVHFPNPVGLAAGFDKNAWALPMWERLGFGYVELGTITRHAQPGNPKPRIFRIPSHAALINRMGFPNEGAVAVATRLRRYRERGQWPRIPVGMNIGKSKVTPLEEAASDYAFSFQQVREFVDFIVINVSSPNTHGLRSLQGREELERILSTVQEENRRGPRPLPILVKIAPDLGQEQVAEVVEVVRQHQGSGIVATNTTLDHTGMPLQQQGGLSGRPLQERSTRVLRWVHECAGEDLPILGAGGIFTAADARAKLDAGATLLQGYTGFIYQGPTWAAEICRGLLTESKS